MKKLLSLLLICCFMTAFAGCSDETKETGASAVDELASVQDDSEKEEETLEERTREIDTENTHVYDESLILTDSEFDALNDYTAWFSKTFKINAAVVLTDDIGDSEPSDYAKNFYESNYSGDGILFLINNDTNEDYFYRRGLPAKFISDADVQMLFSEISPMLVMEEYNAAAERVLEEAELSLPEYFNDRTGELEADEIRKYNNYIRDSSLDGKLNVYYVKGTGDDTIEEFTQKRFEMFHEGDSDTAMLVIDGENGENYLYLSGNMGYLLTSKEEIYEAVKSCYTPEAGMDLENAVKKFIGFVE